MRKKTALALSLLLILPGFPARAEETVKLQATVIVASNEGHDYDLVNDAYRDELIKLFSYSAYHQLDMFSRDLKKTVREKVSLEGGYELVLTLQGVEKGRILVQAVIRKGGQLYVDTVLSILRPGVVFLGGPPLGQGAMIILLEAL